MQYDCLISNVAQLLNIYINIKTMHTQERNNICTMKKQIAKINLMLFSKTFNIWHVFIRIFVQMEFAIILGDKIP